MAQRWTGPELKTICFHFKKAQRHSLSLRSGVWEIMITSYSSLSTKPLLYDKCSPNVFIYFLFFALCKRYPTDNRMINERDSIQNGPKKMIIAWNATDLKHIINYMTLKIVLIINNIHELWEDWSEATLLTLLQLHILIDNRTDHKPFRPKQ